MYKDRRDDKFNDRKKGFDDSRDNLDRGNDGQNEKDIIFGRNSVQEAIKAERPLDSIMVARGERSGSIPKILADGKNAGIPIKEVDRKKLDFMCGHGNHQGIIAVGAVKAYSTIDDIFATAEERGEAPFIIVCDEIEDPHNLGAIIRTANLAGAHGVIIPKHRAVGLTATVARTSAGALNYTPVAKVTNLGKTIDELKEQGIWFACADMGGEVMYRTNLTGAIGLVIGNEGEGVSRLVKEKCDYITSIPMKGDIDSLNASVAAGVLAYEIVRQRLM